MFPLLVLLFIGLPILELYVIIQVGQAIGVVPTLALLIVDSLVGAALARSQSRAAWQRFNLALAEGRIPARETFDGAMVILGGALMVTPGFVTDLFALALLLPPTRAMVRRALARTVARRGRVVFGIATPGSRRGFGHRPGPAPPPHRPTQRPGYDYEGSAREVGDAGELPEGERRNDD